MTYVFGFIIFLIEVTLVFNTGFLYTLYFDFCIHCSVLTTQNLVSIHHHTVDPLYSFHPPPAPSPLVITTLFSVTTRLFLFGLVCSFRLLFGFYIPHLREIVLYAIAFNMQIFKKALKLRDVELSPFIVEEAKVQRGMVNWPRSHSQSVTELVIEPRSGYLVTVSANFSSENFKTKKVISICQSQCLYSLNFSTFFLPGSATRYHILDPGLGQVWADNLCTNQTEVHLNVPRTMNISKWNCRLCPPNLPLLSLLFPSHQCLFIQTLVSPVAQVLSKEVILAFSLSIQSMIKSSNFHFQSISWLCPLFSIFIASILVRATAS